ncbi:tail fiber domain-containing protein [Roseateles sp. BYS96W]|uniref:Tail fiber domain-containing protein n=1 Tax=Pelomonas nitida TaxID=3299027 RepID=A0ABW7G4S7_9BURK
MKKDPGDIMLAADWNEMQVQAREALAGHRHTGGADAEPITREGIAPGAVDRSRIAPNAVDGTLIDPQADVALKALKVNGRVLLKEIDAIVASVKDLTNNPLVLANTLQVNGASRLNTQVDINGPLTVNGVTTINGNLMARGTQMRFSLAGNGGGQLVLANNTNDNRLYLEAFNTAGNGSAAELLLTGVNATPVPQISLIANQTVTSGNLRTHALIVEDQVSSHVTNDGAFYRWDGQVYINVDDNLYIRDSSRGIRMHFDTISGIFKTDMLRLGDKWRLSGVGDSSANDEWLRLFNISGNGYYGGFAADKMWTSKGTLAGSDARLKHAVAPISGALTKALSLRGVTFHWNAAPDERGDAGVIAQEVESVMPQLVHTGPDGFKGVNYNGLIGVLIEAIREQQTMIDQLKRAVAPGSAP